MSLGDITANFWWSTARRVFILGFNYTRLDIHKSRRFGVMVANRRVVREVLQLISADANRQNFQATPPNLVISPENSRDRLAQFIKKARRELLIYDPNVSDDAMIRLLKARAKAGVRVRILGKLEKQWRGEDLLVEDLLHKRLHVRAIIRDGCRAFVGSQSLRKLELDEHREVGVILRDPKLVKSLVRTFEADLALTPSAETTEREVEKSTVPRRLE